MRRPTWRSRQERRSTLPKDAQFADAGIKSGAVPDGAPEGTVGVLNYIYNERKIGSAYLMTKAGAEAPAAAEGSRRAETTAAEETSEGEHERCGSVSR